MMTERNGWMVDFCIEMSVNWSRNGCSIRGSGDKLCIEDEMVIADQFSIARRSSESRIPRSLSKVVYVGCSPDGRQTQWHGRSGTGEPLLGLTSSTIPTRYPLCVAGLVRLLPSIPECGGSVIDCPRGTVMRMQRGVELAWTW